MSDPGSRPPVLIASPDESVREVLARLVETAGHEAVRLDPAVDVPDAVVATSAGGLVLDLGAANQAVLEAVRARTEATAAGVRIVVIGSGPAGGRLALNAGADGSIIVGKLQEAKDYAFGWNAQTGEYGDLYKWGIIDPAKVVRTAIEDAASVAGLLITTEAMIAEKPKKEAAPAMPGGGGMDF